MWLHFDRPSPRCEISTIQCVTPVGRRAPVAAPTLGIRPRGRPPYVVSVCRLPCASMRHGRSASVFVRWSLVGHGAPLRRDHVMQRRPSCSYRLCVCGSIASTI